MKRSLIILIDVVCALVVLVGCTVEGRDVDKGRLVTVIDVNSVNQESNISYEFRYDDSGRVSDMSIFVHGNEQDRASFSYSSDKIILTGTLGELYSYEWELNSRGLVNSRKMVSDDSEYVYYYAYGEDRLLYAQSMLAESYNINEIYERENGNVVRSISTVYYDEYSQEYTDEYYYTFTSSVDKSNLDIMAVIGNGCLSGYPVQITEMDKSVFKSLGNRNLPKTFINPNNPEDSWNFTYAFDKYGYLKGVDVFMDNNLEFRVSVIYNK